MKYFTKEMWRGLQGDSRSQYWEEKWAKSYAAYEGHLAKAKPRLSQKAFEFLSSDHRHGDHILRVEMVNKGKVYFQRETKELHIKDKRDNPFEIMIATLCPKNYINTLSYKNIRKYIFDYPTSLPLWLDGQYCLGAWGYDEFSLLKDDYFRHEIILHSGATILIECKQFDYSRRKFSAGI